MPLIFDEDFVDVESVAVASVLAFQSTCINRSEFNTPEADRFPANSYASFSEQVLDIQVAQVKAIVQPDGVGNDIGWESVAFVNIHAAILSIPGS